LDAFSCWPELEPRRPLIAVANQPHGDRARFSVAHELGHLVMHHPPRGTVGEMEKEADQFAAEFLLPEVSMRQELVRPVTLTSIAQLKVRWRVSMQALIRRARDLEIISPRQYRYLFDQMIARRWVQEEPPNLNISQEKPRAVRKMAEVLYGNPPDTRRMANDLALPVPLLDEMITVHASLAELPSKSRRGAEAEHHLVPFPAPGGRPGRPSRGR
jgi:Zn-dependent peptidase ImmA (M78 family)